MTLPSTGVLTAAMINTELGRASDAPFNLDDAEVRALAGIPSGTISFSDLRGKSSEIVVNLASVAAIDRMDLLFSPEDWASETTKRVIVPAGTELGHATRNYAIAVGLTSGGQAGSFGGRLILENHGIISGCGGAANGGAGGAALYANLLGRDGQPLEVDNLGIIRGGGGGGGRGGDGGAGGGGSYTVENVEGPYFGIINGSRYTWRTGSVGVIWADQTIATNVGSDITTITVGSVEYRRGAYQSLQAYEISRVTRTTTNTNGGGGGAGGNGGAGQGYGQAASAGVNGAAGALGGTNAGRGGTGGRGGDGGGWGANGAAGATGNTGAAGNRTGGVAGAGGAAGGLAGAYVDGASRVSWVATGTRQGRAIN